MKSTDKKYNRKLLTEKYPIKKDDRFLELIDDLEVKIDEEKYHNSIFFFKGEILFFEQDSKNDTFWCSYDIIWLVFEREYRINCFEREREYGLNCTEIQSFIKYMMEKHFKMEVSTPLPSSITCFTSVEEHFKMMASTPLNDDFKLFKRWKNISK